MRVGYVAVLAVVGLLAACSPSSSPSAGAGPLQASPPSHDRRSGAPAPALSSGSPGPTGAPASSVPPDVSAQPGNGGSPSPPPTPTPTPTPTRSYPSVAAPSNPARVGGTPVVYLTFDDGPASPGTADVLAALTRHGAVGTFMVVGYLAHRYPQVLRAILAQGSTIGNHTYSHKYLTRVDDAQLRWQLRATQRAVEAATGASPTCLRPPYGAVDDRVRYLAQRQGLAVQMWDDDWTAGSTAYERRATPAKAAARVLAGLHPGSVVLLHDGEDWGPKTARILDLVLTGIAAKGWGTAPLCAMR